MLLNGALNRRESWRKGKKGGREGGRRDSKGGKEDARMIKNGRYDGKQTKHAANLPRFMALSSSTS
jgi:hypothetical protein